MLLIKNLYSRIKFILPIIIFLISYSPSKILHSEWLVSTLDSPRYFKNLSNRSLTIDKNNHIHIVYGGDHLYHTYYDGRGWLSEVVDEEPSTGWYANISIDKNNFIHIVYYDSKNMVIKYATNLNNKWEISTIGHIEIDTYYNTTNPLSLALDSKGGLHIVYCDEKEERITYLTNSLGTWQSQIIENLKWISTPCSVSIAVDFYDKIHISYYNSVSENLKYATNLSGIWKTEVVDNSKGSGINNYILVNREKEIHIFYFDYNSKDLKYAVNRSGIFRIETILKQGMVGMLPVAAIDPSGKLHILYYNENNSLIYYLTKNNNEWFSEVIDSAITNTSIAVDLNGKVLISYIDNNYILKNASKEGKSWKITELDTSAMVGEYNQVFFDEKNRLNIIYMNYFYNSDKKFIHLTRELDVWLKQDFEFKLSNNIYSIYIVKKNLYVLYSENKMYKLAQYVNNKWDITDIVKDDKDDTISIAIDYDSKPYIAYTDNYTYKISYAKVEAHELYFMSLVDGEWKREFVAQDRYNYGKAYISLDSLQQPHLIWLIFYSSNTEDKTIIHHIYKDSGEWVIQPIDTSTPINLISYVIDRDDKIHLTYCDSTYLKYATNKSGNWEIVYVPNAQCKNISEKSIILDQYNRIHIAYISNEEGCLNLATKFLDSWTNKVIDCSDSIVAYSLISDTNNHFHIVYSGYWEKDLKYATDSVSHLRVKKIGESDGDIISYPDGINCGDICNAKFYLNSKITLHIINREDSQFAGWRGDCAKCWDSLECNIYLNSDKHCAAEFVKKPKFIDVNKKSEDISLGCSCNFLN